MKQQALFAFVSVLAAGLAFAAHAKMDEALKGEGWKLLTLPGERSTTFTPASDGGIRIEAADAVGFLYRPLAASEAEATSLSWRWLVIAAAPKTVLSRKDGDDRSLAIHVWFPADKPEVGFGGFIKRRLGVPEFGRMLTYVHGGEESEGSRFPNPYTSEGAIIVLRSGMSADNQWTDESVDIAADYEAAFGLAPPPAAYLAVSSDTDATGATAIGIITDLRFSSSP